MTKKSRYNKIMEIQKQISKDNLRRHLGKDIEVLVENKNANGKYYIGRSYMDVPEIDGLVYIKKEKDKTLKIGDFVKCKVIDVNDYDLIAK